MNLAISPPKFVTICLPNSFFSWCRDAVLRSMTDVPISTSLPYLIQLVCGPIVDTDDRLLSPWLYVHTCVK